MSLPVAVLEDFDRAQQTTEAPLVWLHMGTDTLWLVRAREGNGAASLALDLGTDSTARLFFRTERPGALELERAIDHVEDELMRAVVWSGGRTVLATGHPLVRALLPTGSVLQREAVEALFQRLASGALGDPSALKGLPGGREAAATLLILRELMHHLGFSQVVVVPPSAGVSLP